MDTIFAALISGGWATVVAGIGFWYNRASLRSVNRNSLNALDAAHAARLWEKSAEVYTEMLKAVAVRQGIRKADIQVTSAAVPDKEQIQKLNAEMRDTDWQDLEARTAAYASSETMEALRDDNELNRRFFDLMKAAKDIGPNVLDPDQLMNADRDATQADDRLAKRVHAELRLRPSQWVDREPVGLLEVPFQPAEVISEPQSDDERL